MPKNTPRTHKRYIVLNRRGKEIDCGITGRDLEVREGERRRGHGDPNLSVKGGGPRVTKEAGKAWEEDRKCSPHDPAKTALKKRKR